MIYAQRVFLGGDVVSQHQVKLVHIAVLAGNGSDGVVRLAVSFRKDESSLIGVASPLGKDNVCQLHKSACVGVSEPYNGHGPLYSSHCNIFKALYLVFLFDICLCHWKGVVSALEMLMAQDRAAYDRQICI